MTKQSYISLAWAGIGVGAILFFVNVVAMQAPNVALTWVSIALVALGAWSAVRAKKAAE